VWVCTEGEAQGQEGGVAMGSGPSKEPQLRRQISALQTEIGEKDATITSLKSDGYRLRREVKAMEDAIENCSIALRAKAPETWADMRDVLEWKKPGSSYGAQAGGAVRVDTREWRVPLLARA